MHIILAIAGAIAGILFWMSRVSRSANEIADAANTIANIPRQRRFSKKYNKSGYDLIETPVEAASVMMIATARMSHEKHVTKPAEIEIIKQLTENMQLSEDDADGLYRQMHSLTYDITLPESALFPMVTILKNEIDRNEAEGLALMMESVARLDGNANHEQSEFIRRFRERMGLLH